MTGGPRFDAVIHAPNRLQICALLSPVDDAEFGVLRDELGVSDSVLSKHLAVLEDAGYITLRKAKGRTRHRTWVSLTHPGRAALASHLAELRRIIDHATVVG